MLEKGGIDYIEVDDCQTVLTKTPVKLFSIDKPTKQMVAKIQAKHKQKCYKYLKKKR